MKIQVEDLKCQIASSYHIALSTDFCKPIGLPAEKEGQGFGFSNHHGPQEGLLQPLFLVFWVWSLGKCLFGPLIDNGLIMRTDWIP